LEAFSQYTPPWPRRLPVVARVRVAHQRAEEGAHLDLVLQEQRQELGRRAHRSVPLTTSSRG